MSKIEVRNITKKYGSTVALDNVSLTFEKDRIYGLLGRNGAGKTTLLSLISNRIFPDHGEVVVGDKNIMEDSSKLKEIYCTTEKGLYPENMKVMELFRWTKEFYANFSSETALDLAESFKLKLNSRIKSLSTGYSTILKDIIALSANTPVILLDEPVLGLDANHRELFYRELIKNYSQQPRTVVISTHLIEEIDGIIEQVVILNEGKIMICDEVSSVTQKGYAVSGPKDNVDEFIKGKNVIGYDLLGGLKSAYIFDEKQPDKINEQKSLEISRLPLQKLFIHLTNGGNKK